MIVVPDSDIILIKSPLKLDNYNQITFSNASVFSSGIITCSPVYFPSKKILK